LNAALDSAVRIEVTLVWPHEEADFSGSGWTRSCTASPAGYTVVIATAGHVLDIDGLINEAHPRSTGRPTVTVRITYRDGRRYTAGREDALRVDRLHDYGEIRLESPEPHRVLPAGVAADVAAGASLIAVGSPGRLAFGVYTGNFVMMAPDFLDGAPPGSWLSSVPAAPGASGSPVLDEEGRVIATVVGYIEWPWGGWNSVLVPLPISLFTSALTNEEVTSMEFMDGLIPLLKTSGVLALAMALAHGGLTLLAWRPALPHNAMEILNAVCEKAVMAIEQAHGDLGAVDKKQLAVQMVTTIFSQMGLKMPPALMDAGIEAAVLVLHHLTAKEAA
jgi:hypothetical protein